MFKPRAKVYVFKAGYEWYEHKGIHELGYNLDGIELDQNPDSPYLTEDRPELFRIYDPFHEEPALFRIFADCETFPWWQREQQLQVEWDGPPIRGIRTGRPKLYPEGQWDRIRASILSFVNRFGKMYYGGYFEQSFAYEVALMQSGISLWEAVRTGNDKEMAKYLGYNKKEQGWFCRHQTPLAEIQSEVPKHWHDAPHKKSDLPERAWELLCAAISAKTSEALQVSPTKVGSRLELCLEVPDLAYVFWVQFALAVSEEKNYDRCGFCNRPFEVAPDVNRKSRKFCSDTCRVKSYYRRRTKAQQMRAGGAHLRAIAKAVDSDLPTVKKWVGEG